jgi:PAS domain S-box-containing protein
MRNRLASVSAILRNLETTERKRLISHAIAIGAVAAAVVVRWIVGVGGGTPFSLLFGAIAVSAACGGTAPALVATLASLLAVRVTTDAPFTAALLFAAEGIVIALVVVVLRASLEDERKRMSAMEPWMRELKSTERQGRLVDLAFNHLDEAADTVVVVLDGTGRVSSWRAGATRLYGRRAEEMVGNIPAVLFDELPDDGFARLISAARQGDAGYTGRQRRGDGSGFDADVLFRPLSRGGFDGFAMIVRDLTSDQAFRQLRQDADVANRQLLTLRHVTDPSLNSMDGSDLVATVLDRLREAIDAEGVALVSMEKFRRRVVCAASGLQSERGVYRPPLDLRRADAGRTLMIHNDKAAVAEASVAGWPGDVSSMMAMPVVRAGSTQGMMEVVHRTGRRATEWEIALVQVAAARIAGILSEDRLADSGAVA